MMSVAGTRAAKAGKDKSSKTAAQNAKSGTEGKNVDGPNPKIQPTAEQMRLAQIINDTKESEDPELKNKIDQVIELTGKTRDEAVVALHDSDNDPNRAIDMLLEGDNDQGEWEMSGKKKKNRQANSVSRPADGTSPNATVNNKENRNRTERGERRDSEKEQEGIRNRGPPRMNRGGGGPSRSWRGRESEKNERNLEDSRNHERSTEGRGRGRMMNGPGRGRGRGGPRSRTFQNRGTNHGGFPKSIDTWSNSTAEQQVEAGGGDSTMSVGNWPDSFPQTEDWDNEDWTGSLTETKVFTPSVSASSAVPPLQDSTNTPQSIDLAALLQKSGQSSNALPATLPNSLSNSQHSQFLSQYNQQATESLKSAVGIQTSQSSSVSSLPSTIVPTSRLPPGSISVGNQQRPKPQRTRLPPPSKIPSTAVEMPDDAIESLDVQFGGLEFGSEPSSFEFTSENSFQTTAGSTASVITNHVTSMTNSQASDLNASLMSTQVPSSNLKTQAESAGRSAYTPPHAAATSKDLVQASLAQSTLTQSSLSQSALSQSSLSQTQKTSASELIPFSHTERKSTTPFANQRSTQGIEATLSGVKGDTSSMNSSYGSQNSHTASYQSSYQSQKPSSAFTAHQSNLTTSNNFSHSSLPGHQSGIGSSQTSLPQSGLSTSPAQTGFSASQGQTAVSFSAVPSVTSAAYQQQTQTSFSTSAQSVPSSYQAQVTASFTTQAQNTFPSQSQSTYGSHSNSSLSQSGSVAFSSTSQPQNSAYGSQSTYGSSSVATVQTHTTLHATPITTSKLTSNLASVKENSLDSSQHSFESCHTATSSTNLTTLTTTTANSLNSSSVNVASTLGLASSTSTSSSTANASKGSMSAGKAGMPSMPPGVPVLGHHQYIMSQASVPFYSLQQPMYSFEDLQMLQQRLPPLATGYYDMASFQPPTSITGRESGLATVAYTGGDGKFSRGDAASPVPTTLSQQQTTTQHQQPFINAAALPPGYGYYYAAGGMVPGSFPQYGTPIFSMPPVTNATSTTQFQQKPTAYASHAYNSGYDNISQTQDYKGGYGSGSQNQGKGVGGSSSTSGGSSSGADISGSVYSKTHTQLGKSFDKPGFPAGTPPPFNMPGTQAGPMGAPSTAYAPPFIAMLAHHQQHPSPMLHHQLHQDSQGTSSQRSNQSGVQQKPGQGSKPNYSTPSYWAPN